jgi:hypothetical protein
MSGPDLAQDSWSVPTSSCRWRRDDVEQRLGGQAEFLGQHERLANRDLLDGQHHVVTQLGGLPRAGGAAGE